ncbi:hypothetical protein ACFLZ7_01725 [Nanoarchaeota archaeon]
MKKPNAILTCGVGLAAVLASGGACSTLQNTGSTARQEMVEQSKAFEKQGDYDKAVSYLAEAGEYRKASRLAEREKLYSTAAHWAEWAGQEYTAKRLYKEGLEVYEKTGDYGNAARCANGLGQIEKAILYYEKAGEYSVAGHLAEEEGMFEESERLYKKSRESKKPNKVEYRLK